MGSDDLFHKRKASAQAVKRQRHPQERKPRILIVCEGEKTERLYLNALCQAWAIPTTSLKIERTQGSSPDQVVSTAQKKAAEEQKKGDAYDEVYCVFDKDTHEHFDAALDRCEAASKSKNPRSSRWHAITSTPCFEFWLLLHFKLSTKSYECTDQKTVCDQVVRELKKHQGFEQYAKKQANVWALLGQHTEKAIENAQLVREQQAQTSNRPQREANPWTNMDQLIGKLQELRELQKQTSTR